MPEIKIETGVDLIINSVTRSSSNLADLVDIVLDVNLKYALNDLSDFNLFLMLKFPENFIFKNQS